jgi:hypothetical protein
LPYFMVTLLVFSCLRKNKPIAWECDLEEWWRKK